MYALQEISTGKWLAVDEVTFITYNEESVMQIKETETAAELEDLRDSFNAKAVGNFHIITSPRPH